MEEGKEVAEVVDEAVLEEAAAEAGFSGEEIQPVEEPEAVIPKEEPIAEVKPVEEPIEEKPEEPDQFMVIRGEMQKIHDRMSGKIGELNSKILDIQKAGSGIAENAKERMLEEFPELGKLLFEADEKKEEVPDVKEVFKAEIDKVTQTMEKRLVLRDHPDFEQKVRSAEYQRWTLTLPEDERTKLANSWDANYISEKITEFKDSLKKDENATGKAEADAAKAKAREEKRKQLEAAISPRGKPALATEEANDEEAWMEKGFSE